MISVDSREPKRIRDKLISKGIEAKGEFLDIGDYLFPGSVIVERKTGKDFVSSIFDKRIWLQAKNLSQYDHPIIAIITDNKWKDFYFRSGKYTHKAWTSTVATLACRYNISVITIEDEDEFVNFLESLHKKLNDDKTTTRPDPIARKPRSLDDRKENALCAADGVSIKKAKQLLDCYGSVKNIANESEKKLQQAPGIGPKLARSIYELFN